MGDKINLEETGEIPSSSTVHGVVQLEQIQVLFFQPGP